MRTPTPGPIPAVPPPRSRRVRTRPSQSPTSPTPPSPDTPKPETTADEPDSDEPTDASTPADTADDGPNTPTKTSSHDAAEHTSKRRTTATATPPDKPAAAEPTAKPATSTDTPPTEPAEPTEPVAKVSNVARVAAPQTFSAAAVPTPAPISVLGVVQGVITAVVSQVGSLVINTVQAIEALVTGPPVLPPGSTVTVRSSTVLLSNGQRVAANWFYPKTDGEPPTNMILLQHGFFALGPMYSYTAGESRRDDGQRRRDDDADVQPLRR